MQPQSFTGSLPRWPTLSLQLVALHYLLLGLYLTQGLTPHLIPFFGFLSTSLALLLFGSFALLMVVAYILALFILAVGLWLRARWAHPLGLCFHGLSCGLLVVPRIDDPSADWGWIAGVVIWNVSLLGYLMVPAIRTLFPSR